MPFGYRDLQQGAAALVGDLGAEGERDSPGDGVERLNHRLDRVVSAGRRVSALLSLPFPFLIPFPFLFRQ